MGTKVLFLPGIPAPGFTRGGFHPSLPSRAARRPRLFLLHHTGEGARRSRAAQGATVCGAGPREAPRGHSEPCLMGALVRPDRVCRACPAVRYKAARRSAQVWAVAERRSGRPSGRSRPGRDARRGGSARTVAGAVWGGLGAARSSLRKTPCFAKPPLYGGA